MFGNLCSALRLNRFSLRGEKKVDIQWIAVLHVHNLLKIHRYGVSNCTWPVGMIATIRSKLANKLRSRRKSLCLYAATRN
ncbi:MAG TPA: hypothetical protein ENK06_05510 [Gammaproteobacteria bacterium]|nr:hypothetical protein [Gammaproteobacteria bacterium]